MGGYLKRWRTKLGIIAALLTLLLAIGWLKSQFFADRIQLATGRHVLDILLSADGLLIWATQRNEDPKVHLAFPAPPRWESHRLTANSRLIDDAGLEWKWRFLRFGIRQYRRDDGSQVAFWMIPYWSVAFPMALAAGLLLSKPQQSKTQKAGSPEISDSQDPLNF